LPISKDDEDEPRLVRRTLYYVFASTFTIYQILLLGGLFVVFIWPRPLNANLTKIVTNHFPAIVGLPTACLMAFAVVWVFRTTEGPLEWEGLGFKFRGASGPVVLWVIVFLSIAAAGRLMW